MDLAAASDLKQLGVRGSVPQHVRQARRLGVAIKPHLVGRGGVCFRALHPKKEFRRTQQAGQGKFQTVVKIT